MSHIMRKHALRSLSLSYQKKDWRSGPAYPPSFGMTPTMEYLQGDQKVTDISRTWEFSALSRSWIILRGPTHQSFFGYDSDKHLKAHFLMTRLVCMDD